MTGAVQRVLTVAQDLTTDEKIELIDELHRSLEAALDPAIAAAWATEADERLDAYAAGRMSADSIEAVLARVRTQ